jgi:hypothetical protein
LARQREGPIEQPDEFSVRVFSPIEKREQQLQTFPLQHRYIAGRCSQGVRPRCGFKISKPDGEHDGPKRMKSFVMQTLDDTVNQRI